MMIWFNGLAAASFVTLLVLLGLGSIIYTVIKVTVSSVLILLGW